MATHTVLEPASGDVVHLLEFAFWPKMFCREIELPVKEGDSEKRTL
jgi:hypothetical protein